MKIASIDIGTNSVILLIAEIKNGIINPIINKYTTPRIGNAISKNGIISDVKRGLLLNIIKEFKKLIDSYKCDFTIAIATNAFRLASNSKEICSYIFKNTGLIIEVVSGDKEAELSYLGASSSFSNLKETILIDIGGGSTEILAGKNKHVLFKKSFDIGVVNLTEEYFRNDPPLINEIEKLNVHLNNVFVDLKNKINNVKNCIAVAGTPTTLSFIDKNIKEYSDDCVEGYNLKLTSIRAILSQLKVLSSHEIRSNYGKVVDGRQDLIFSGAMILESILNNINCRSTQVSTRGIRYGAILNYLENLKG